MKLTKKVLYKSSKICDFKWPYQNQLLAEKMLKFMQQQNGIGLAAPQIGISKRIFVMEVDGRQRKCFNPKIIESSNVSTEFDEGCLSFPGDQCTINRPIEVLVKYQDHQGEWYSDRLTGLEARCFQHELDHLDGITMYDRLKEQNAK